MHHAINSTCVLIFWRCLVRFAHSAFVFGDVSCILMRFTHYAFVFVGMPHAAHSLCVTVVFSECCMRFTYSFFSLGCLMRVIPLHFDFWGCLMRFTRLHFGISGSLLRFTHFHGYWFAWEASLLDASCDSLMFMGLGLLGRHHFYRMPHANYSTHVHSYWLSWKASLLWDAWRESLVFIVIGLLGKPRFYRLPRAFHSCL